MLFLQIIVISSLLVIFYQDFKERLVYWWLFPITGIIFALIHLNKVGMSQFLIHIAFTMTIVSLLLGVLWVYIKLRPGNLRFKDALGLGDILFLIALALGFSPISFMTLIVFGFLFTLVLHQLLQVKQKKTVPLAGYLALFFTGVLIFHAFGGYPDLYMI